MKPALIGLALCGAAAAVLTAQVFYAPKGKPGVYTAPHKPHTKLAEVKAKHKGQAEWREAVVKDQHLESNYVQHAAGFRHAKAMHPDTRAWWVVLDGQVRFEIEGVDSFTAAKGSMVQVPMQTMFSYAVVGDRPALLFETNIAGAKTLYVNESEAPQAPVGTSWVKVAFPNRVKSRWLHNNKPHVTFEEVASKLEKGELKGTIRIVEDDRGTANFIYGYHSKLPPLDVKNKGHYHPEGAEYWLILKGQIRYPIESVGVVIAEEGDVVYVPPYTFHAPRWWGDGPSCRLAFNGFPQIAHLFEAH